MTFFSLALSRVGRKSFFVGPVPDNRICGRYSNCCFLMYDVVHWDMGLRIQLYGFEQRLLTFFSLALLNCTHPLRFTLGLIVFMHVSWDIGQSFLKVRKIQEMSVWIVFAFKSLLCLFNINPIQTQFVNEKDKGR